jgi:hypothetical protein
VTSAAINDLPGMFGIARSNLGATASPGSRSLQGSAVSMRASVVPFALIDVVPHIGAIETHERL